MRRIKIAEAKMEKQELEREVRLLQEQVAILSDRVVILQDMFCSCLRELEDRNLITEPAEV
jgi:hypothetical protein